MARPNKLKYTEEQLATVAVSHLQEMGYETYEEVHLGPGPRPDIVGLQGSRIAIVEVKRSMSLTLLNQIMHWRGQVHYVYGAIGAGRIGMAADRLCRQEGLGLWQIDSNMWGQNVTPDITRATITSALDARMYRHKTALWTLDRIREACNDHNRSGSSWAAAGSKAGGYWTPFAQTRRELGRMVKKDPGKKMEEYLAAMSHHYASINSGKASLYDLIRRGILKEFELRRGERGFRVYPRDVTIPKTEEES